MAVSKEIFALFLLLNIGGATTLLDTIWVTTIESPPFVKQAGEDSTDSRWGYKGILIDLLAYILEHSKLFTKDVVPKVFNQLDDYGHKLPNGSWTGIINKVAVNERRSLGLADVTITSEKLEAVQFSLPFFSTGLSAVGKGLDFALDTENLPKLLKMAQEDKVRVGCQTHDAPEAFFRTTEIEIYKKLYEQMKKHDDNFVQSYAQGVAKIRESPADKPYVFFGEKAALDYIVNKKPCDLKISECSSLTTLEYGLVFNKDSNPDYVNGFNKAIADYLASGKMQESVQKWYKNECK